MPSASTEILIHAPIDRVWTAMTDIKGYQNWNPFVEKIECASLPPAVGSDLTLHVRFANGKKVTTIERITRLNPPASDPDGQLRATLEYRFLGILANLNMVRGSRPQIIEQVDANTTRYRTSETLSGWLSWAAPIKLVQDGFERHAAALKRYCEETRQDADEAPESAG